MDKQFSIREILLEAWSLAKSNLWVMMGITFTQYMIILIAVLVSGFSAEKSALGFVQNILIGLIDGFFTVVFYKIFFKLIDEGGEATFPDFLLSLGKALTFVLVKLIVGLGVVLVIASLAAIYFANAPSTDSASLFQWKDLLHWSWKDFLLLIAMLSSVVYLSLRTCFAICFIVDQDARAIESIRQSWALTKGHCWFLFFLFLVILGINILGTMALFIGLLFTIPFSSLILIVTYRQMVNLYVEEEFIRLENSKNEQGS